MHCSRIFGMKRDEKDEKDDEEDESKSKSFWCARTKLDL